MEALLGRAKFFEKVKKYDIALEILSEISVSYRDFLPGLIEKSKIHILSGDYDQGIETIQKVIMEDRQNIEAIRIIIFYHLSRESNIPKVLE